MAKTNIPLFTIRQHCNSGIHHFKIGAFRKPDPGVEKLVVTTSQLAYQFFEKFGYRFAQTEQDYWAPGLDLYRLEQKLQKENAIR